MEIGPSLNKKLVKICLTVFDFARGIFYDGTKRQTSTALGET